MAEQIFALFESTPQARRAIRALVSAEFRREEVTAYSTEPTLEPEFLPPDMQKSRLPMFALGGGILGAVAGYLLPSLTAQAMNLPTGGQPIVSLWPFAIVIFELTALGAIGGTFIALLREAGLPRLKGKIYDDEFADDLAQGGVLLSVTSDQPERLEAAGQLLHEAGAKKVKPMRGKTGIEG